MVQDFFLLLMHFLLLKITILLVWKKSDQIRGRVNDSHATTTLKLVYHFVVYKKEQSISDSFSSLVSKDTTLWEFGLKRRLYYLRFKGKFDLFLLYFLLFVIIRISCVVLRYIFNDNSSNSLVLSGSISNCTLANIWEFMVRLL